MDMINLVGRTEAVNALEVGECYYWVSTYESLRTEMSHIITAAKRHGKVVTCKQALVVAEGMETQKVIIVERIA